MIGILKHKISQSNECKNGKHVYVPSMWEKNSANTREICTAWTCQHCLIHLEKSEVEVMRDYHNGLIKDKHVTKAGE